MKGLIVIFIASAFALHADETAATKPAPPPAPVDEVTVSHQGYTASRYQSLWTQSPFAVETPDEDPTESAEYSLVGVYEIDGVSSASLIEKQNQNHLLISSDKPINGLTLTSITRRADGDTYANLTRDGQPITLKLEAPPANAALQTGAQANGGLPMPGAMAPNMPGIVAPNIQMPGSTPQSPGRPLIRIRRPIIHVPARMPEAQPAAQPAGQPPPPPPAQ
jgi:hypothetical protein